MFRRNIEIAIRAALADTPVVLINGARQTGKTTLAQAIAQETGAVVASTTLPPSRRPGRPSGRHPQFPRPRRPRRSPEGAGAVLGHQAGRGQEPPARAISPDGLRQRLTLPRLSESLAGRMEVIPLFPFSAGELVGQAEASSLQLFCRHDPEARPLIRRLPSLPARCSATASPRPPYERWTTGARHGSPRSLDDPAAGRPRPRRFEPSASCRSCSSFSARAEVS